MKKAAPVIAIAATTAIGTIVLVLLLESFAGVCTPVDSSAIEVAGGATVAAGAGV